MICVKRWNFNETILTLITKKILENNFWDLQSDKEDKTGGKTNEKVENNWKTYIFIKEYPFFKLKNLNSVCTLFLDIYIFIQFPFAIEL